MFVTSFASGIFGGERSQAGVERASRRRQKAHPGSSGAGIGISPHRYLMRHRDGRMADHAVGDDNGSR
ncbi:hypothetical protein [Pseudonocardia aurantiaca]|uniref:Uncharacterized protein n=1 Tax=Pseudonocardia aurantiaca TaxID=75290 RepID=A0ABW4FN17_9PSEU